MYTPKSFVIDDQKTTDQFIQNHAFGQLISRHNNRLFSTHLPFLYDADNRLIVGHIAKANPQHTDIEGQDVMLTIQGAHGYISPTWYSSKNVPTWNYQAVHIYGQCQVFTDPDKLKDVVDSLTKEYERHLPEPWQPDYRSTMLQGIVGLAMSVSEIEVKFKLSQNRSPEDIQGVIDHLDPVKQAELISAMKSVVNNQVTSD